MKIVSKREFLSLPSGTIFSHLNEYNEFNNLFKKGESLDNDFYEQSLIDELGFPAGDSGVDTHHYFEQKIKDGTDFRIDFNCEGRDGLFEKNPQYVIYDKIDIYNLIKAISTK